MNKRLKIIFLTLLLFCINSCSSQESLWWCGTGDYEEENMKINVSEFSYKFKPDSVMIIEGEILDSLRFEPLIGANVVVTSKDLKIITGAATDINGNFVLSFKYDPNYLIKFSYIGYRQQNYKLKHFLQQFFEY
jgi:hypothetical protein